jgi:hypothetical protein
MVFWALTGGGPRRPGRCPHKPPRGELTPAFSPPLCLLAQRRPQAYSLQQRGLQLAGSLPRVPAGLESAKHFQRPTLCNFLFFCFIRVVTIARTA